MVSEFGFVVSTVTATVTEIVIVAVVVAPALVPASLQSFVYMPPAFVSSRLAVRR